MAQKKQLDKASSHLGRANSKGVVYNANHNTMEEARSNQPHIDQERISLNEYFQFMEDWSRKMFHGGKGGFDARKHELHQFEKLYGEGLKARNERYTKSGHKDRCKKMNKVYRDPKTAPTEVIFQLGKKGSEIDEQKRTEVMVAAWNDVVTHLCTKYGANLFPLDAALHRDETNDHIHFRFTLGARDKFGHMVPNQSQALEAMGFDGRNPATGKKDRYHNPLVAFTDEVRETFYQACERRGIAIDREVSSGSRRQLELLTQKCMGLEKEIEQQNQELGQLERELEKAGVNKDAAERKAREAEKKAQKAAEAAEIAQDDKISLEKKLTALRASQAALEAESKRLSDKKAELEEKLAEVRATGQSLADENKQLKADNEQLRSDNAQLRAENEQLKQEARAEQHTLEVAKLKTAAEADKQAKVLEKQMKNVAERDILGRIKSKDYPGGTYFSVAKGDYERLVYHVNDLCSELEKMKKLDFVSQEAVEKLKELVDNQEAYIQEEAEKMAIERFRVMEAREAASIDREQQTQDELAAATQMKNNMSLAAQQIAYDAMTNVPPEILDEYQFAMTYLQSRQPNAYNALMQAQNTRFQKMYQRINERTEDWKQSQENDDREQK